MKNGANMNLVCCKGYVPLAEALLCYNNHFTDYNEKIMIKKLVLIIENTNFNMIYKSYNIFTSCNVHWPEYFWKLLLQHIAKLLTIDVTVNSNLLNIIATQGKYNDYYKQCEMELLQAKNTRLENSWISFYNLLMDNRRKLKNYASNEDLIYFNKNKCNEKFPIYGRLMYKNVKKGTKRRELFDKTAIELSNCLPIFNTTHLIITDILDCILEKKNLSKLCNI